MPVTESRIADLLCAGFEGGVGYWAQITDHIVPETVWKGPGWEKHVYPYVHYPLSDGGGIVLRDAEDEEGLRWVLDRRALHRGLALFPVKSPHHFAQWLQENEDADSGDVFIQLCLFGRIVYG